MVAGCCSSCGAQESGRFCTNCGTRMERESKDDAFIGAMVADRYEIVALLKTGGMGRVYRAHQYALDRDVAVKIVDPTLGTSPEFASRFIQEARAASRLNHPNVVSIYDFGKMQEGPLYMVMELLTGRDLSTLLREEWPLSLETCADILRQTLAALHEAHEANIVHRDVKPENILVDRSRDGQLRVKVIDFGVARVGGAKLTRQGLSVGTPHYMAPESIRGTFTRSVDLYAVGVCLFEMLTGQVPFDAPSLTSVLRMHETAQRPDPRDVAPHRGISAALAEVCKRALDIDAARRYPDAPSLAMAITQAATAEKWSPRHASLFPGHHVAPSSGRPGAGSPVAPHGPTEPFVVAPASEGGAAALYGRASELEWGREKLRNKVAGIVYWGKSGIGRTRVLRELCDGMTAEGGLVVKVSVPTPPGGEVSGAGLKRMVRGLTGRPTVTTDAWRDSARAACEALRKAASVAEERARGAPILLAIDDADTLDHLSQCAIEDLLLSPERPPDLSVLLTSERTPDTSFFEGVHERQLLGLSAADVAPWLGRTPPREEDIEPLYVEELLRWINEGRRDDPPASLHELVEARLRALSPSQRSVLQASAVVGAATRDVLDSLVGSREVLDEGLPALLRGGMLVEDDGVFVTAHAICRRAVLAMSPSGALVELHERAKDTVGADPALAELRTYHALRGRPDFGAFLQVESCARDRQRRGDDESAMALLYDGVRVARAQVLLGDEGAAASALSSFGLKLGELLITAGRLDEASGVLGEILEHIAKSDSRSTALVQVELALIAEQRGRPGEAKRRREKSMAIAEQRSDAELTARLRAWSSHPPTTGVRRRSMFPRISTTSGKVPAAAPG
jgi:protein kinase-like protein